MKLRAKHRFHISIVSFLCVGTLAASLCSCEKKKRRTMHLQEQMETLLPLV